MAFTHTLQRNWVGNGTSKQSSVNYSGDGQSSIDASIPNTSDNEIAIEIDVSQIQSIYIVAAAAMTLETNSSSTPTDTITLVADTPYIWHTGSYFTNLLTADVTKIFMTNASGAAANFRLECVYDSTL